VHGGLPQHQTVRWDAATSMTAGWNGRRHAPSEAAHWPRDCVGSHATEWVHLAVPRYSAGWRWVSSRVYIRHQLQTLPQKPCVIGDWQDVKTKLCDTSAWTSSPQTWWLRFGPINSAGMLVLECRKCDPLIAKYYLILIARCTLVWTKSQYLALWNWCK